MSVLYRAVCDGPGVVSFLAKPRPGDWLDDEMAALAAAGVDVLVSLLTPGEVVEVGLEDEPYAAVRAGLRFVHAPVPDRGVPDARFVAVVLPELTSAYRAGRHVAVHCRFGIGRSATVAAAVLVATGHDPDVVWRELSAVRGVAVPDVEGQRRWVERFLT